MRLIRDQAGDDRVRLRRHRFRDIWNPLSTRERLVYGLLTLFLLVIIFGPLIRATNQDLGELFLIPAEQCQSQSGWLSPSNASGPSQSSNLADKNLINQQNSAVAVDSSRLVCEEFKNTKKHIITKPSLELVLAVFRASPEDELTQEAESENVDVSGPIKLNSRPNVILPNASESTTNSSIDELIRIFVSNDSGTSWQLIHTVDSSFVTETNPLLSIAIPDNFALNPTKLSFAIELSSINSDRFVYVESVGLGYEVGAGQELKATLLNNIEEEEESDKPLFNQGEVKFLVVGKDPADGLWQGLANKLSQGFTDGESPELKANAQILDENGNELFDVPLEVAWQGTSLSQEIEWQLTSSTMPDELMPGSYTISLELTDQFGVTQTIEQDFLWGVLAFNSNKSIYRIGDRAEFAMTVLDERGATVCDSDVSLSIFKDEVLIQTLSTANRLITINESCSVYGDHTTADYQSSYLFNLPGTYQLSLTAETENGIFTITDSLSVVESVEFDVERFGPTRLYPIVNYSMSINVTALSDESVLITEKVPKSFSIIQPTDAVEFEVTSDDLFNILTWKLFLQKDITTELRYIFDPPDIAPAFYTLKPLIITSQDNNQVRFEEFRQWQLAGDAIGHMLLLFDGVSVPSGWSCISCTGGDAFYQRFIRGNSTYGGTGGSAQHTHTVGAGVDQTSSTNTIDSRTNGSVNINNAHSHSLTPTVSPADNLPSYRQLKVIRYDTAGEPTTLPAGVIGFFDTTLPGGWTRYGTQDGYYIRGENTVGSTGGSNTHNFSVTGTTTQSTGGTVYNTQQTGQSAATSSHTHTVNITSGSNNHEPPFIETILAKLDSDSAPPGDLIAMWDDEPTSSWDVVSDNLEPFHEMFIKASASYGTTGGSVDHSHADFNGNTSAASASNPSRAGSTVVVSSHVHNVDITSVSTESNLPPYRDVVFAKRLTGTIVEQSVYRWFANANSTDVGSPLAGEDTTATLATDGDTFRLRIGMHISLNELAISGKTFKLQYAEQSGSCDPSFVDETYSDVSPSSGTIRYYDNPLPSDGSALTTNANDPTHESHTMRAQTYEEANNFTNSQSAIAVGEDGYWDFALVDHSADFDVTYCFRIIESDGTPLQTYSVIPEITTSPPPARMHILFDGASIPSGWSCVSCDSGDPVYQRFIRGNSTYSGNGGSANHTPTATANLQTTGSGGVGSTAGTGSGVIANNHTHTITPTFGSASNLPLYRQLKVIRYDAGTPAQVPAGGIAFFASATMPDDWTRYSAQDGYYARGEGTAGTTGGSNTHSHSISGTSSGPSGTNLAPDSGSQNTIATDTHTHTVSGSSDSLNNEPPFFEMVLGQADIDVDLPTNFRVMFDKTPPGGWDCFSCNSGEDMYQRFFKAESTFGGSGGSLTHQHGNQTVVSSGPNQTGTTKPGSAGTSASHTHNLDLSSYSTDNHLPPYIDFIFASKGVNTAPDSPTALTQKRVSAGTTIGVGEWTNETQVRFEASATDTDNPDDLKLCVEAEIVGTAFDDVPTACGSAVSYTGSSVTVSVTLTGLTAEQDYHWQAKITDASNDSSAWVSFGGNPESGRDFAIDITAPTGTVYDGTATGVDVDLNNGSLDSLSANWSINSASSGLDEYEYSIGTSPADDDVRSWTAYGTGTSVTANSLSLQTSQVYYFNVRTTDNAGNQSTLSSDGILVAPTLSFSTIPVGVQFDILNLGNNFTSTKATTLTTSTNAYNGYVIRAYAVGLLTNQYSTTIGFFDGGSYGTPDGWTASDRGFGYTSSDTTIQGINLFNPVTCLGGNSSPCYAPYTTTSPGDIVADHTDLVTSTPIIDESFVITHRVTTDATQEQGTYTTEVIYSAIPIY